MKMNEEFGDLLGAPEAKLKKTIDRELIKALEQRQVGVNKNNVPLYDLQVTAEDVFVKKEFKELRCEMPGTPRSTFLMVFSPDGTKVASTHGNHNIHVTDIRSGKNIRTLVGHPRTPWCIAFHPTSNQILASGCLGGQVRIWDLSGGSEVWTADTQTVIASIAFHPDDRLLVIATYNELHFWDWSKPEPFMHVSTNNIKEKVRYVAFDKLGHKLITGIANSPQTRWERVRAPVPVPRQVDRAASPYRRRITPRLISNNPVSPPLQSAQRSTNREPLSTVPERERRITACYRNLVREYELLVHRYLQLYRPPTMIDQGTDPMELDAMATSRNNQTSQPSTSGLQSAQASSNSPWLAVPSTSGTQNQNTRLGGGQKASPSTSAPAVSRKKSKNTPPKPSTSSSLNFTHCSTCETTHARPTFGLPLFSSSARQHLTTEASGTSRRLNSTYSFHPQSSISATQAFQAAPSIPHDMVLLTPSEICSLRRSVRKFRSTQTQNSGQDCEAVENNNNNNNNNQSEASAPSTSGLQNRNERRNSAPASTVYDLENVGTHKLRKGESEQKLLQNTVGQGSTMKVASHDNLDDNRKHQSTGTPNVSKSVTPSASSTPTQSPRRLLIISRNLGPPTATDKDEVLELNGDTSFKVRIRCSPNSSSTTPNDAGQPSTSAGPPKTHLSNLLQNAEKLFSKCFVTYNSARSTAESAAPPSTDATERPSFFEQARKRAYPGFPKKTARRTILDSSSNTSSSEEDDYSKRQVPPSRLPTASNNNNNSTLIDATPESTPPAAQNADSADNPSSRTSLNFNAELEMLVTDLLANNDNAPGPSPSVTAHPSRARAGGAEDGNRTENNNGEPPRNLMQNRRFFSAFSPTRMQNMRSYARLRRRDNPVAPAMRNMLRSLGLPETFAMDEVINYSERANSEEEIPEPSAAQFHPFDPPPEYTTINPENIGIGNMYSNIVQELESSLNDVRNIRASSRLGETSDMLSSFSERLESIMNQSNSILRNLRSSIDTLTPSSYDARQLPRTEPQLLFNDRSFYVRDQGSASSNEMIEDSNTHGELFSNHNSAVAADHTYPLNSRDSPGGNVMTPLMVSLHLTVSHIQRQARLLRQQVESIERIDRAMLEVAQLQLLRQMFADMQRYMRDNSAVENPSTVSSVRQMMAGTRISDSSPYDSPSEEGPSPQTQRAAAAAAEAGPSTSAPPTANENQNASGQNRKTYPRCIFLMHRNLRRGGVASPLQRRYVPRERITRRHIYRRAFTCRSLIPRSPVNLSTNRSAVVVAQPPFNLHSIIRRLEQFLMDHGRNIGRPTEPVGTGLLPTDRDEYILMLRLNHCRARVNVLLGYSEAISPTFRRQSNSVTAEGASRYGARDTLISAADTLCKYLLNGIPSTPSLRLIIWDVIDLSVLLSEILLLQIVDSIPPPTGMNLDPERESLSVRIDQMCSRILQSRLSGHSHQLTRSLRLTRVAVRHASSALDQTYTARRNAMLPSGNERDQRRELLAEIDTCLRNIRRNHAALSQSTSAATNEQNSSENFSRREWYRTIYGHIAQYGRSPSVYSEDQQPSTSAASAAVNVETGEEQGERPGAGFVHVSSDDDTEPDGFTNNLSRERRPLYRTNNVNLLNSSEDPPSNRNRPWNVPTVQVNDIPISQYQSQWQQRFSATRQRISERFSELRSYTIGRLYRPRFLHPLYAGVNPFDADLDESTREQIYDSDIIAAVSPHHRIQVWEFSTGIIPNINNALKNVIVNECRIHNDASVAIAADGSILVALLPSGGYINIANRLGIYSLEWETLGQCLYVATFDQNAVSVSLSPLSRHLVVGLTSRRVSIIPSDKWTMARIFLLEEKRSPCSQLASIREVEQSRDPNYMSVNCIRWLPLSGQGLIYGTNTGQLRVLT